MRCPYAGVLLRRKLNASEGLVPMWIVFAFLSACFAAATSILAKIGIGDVNANLATAIRTAVVLIMAWGIVFITGTHKGIHDITMRSWIFLALSGCATGLSWLFYFRALQMGSVSKVVPVDKLSVVISMLMAFIILGEKVDVKTVVGGILITIGTIVIVL
jgi:transporter family protein